MALWMTMAFCLLGTQEIVANGEESGVATSQVTSSCFIFLPLGSKIRITASLLKGSILEAFGNMTSLEYLDMSRNQLQGSIPEAFGNMVSLKYLDMRDNQLQGSIPEAFGNMTSLEHLDMSWNQLQGSIPEAVGNMTSLEGLYLYANKLEGTQLQSFNTSSYEGNPTLCGLPLLKKCPRDKAEGAPNAYSYEDSIQQDGNDMWFYVSIALGFIVGFWGVCGTLLLNNSWRYAYFRFLNKIKDWLYVTTTINMARLRRSLQS